MIQKVILCYHSERQEASQQVSDCDCHLCDSLSQWTVCDSIIKCSVDLSLDFHRVDPNDLSAIFKWVSTKALLFDFFCLWTCFRLEGSIHTCQRLDFPRTGQPLNSSNSTCETTADTKSRKCRCCPVINALQLPPVDTSLSSPMSILKKMTRRTIEMRMREVIPTDQGGG